MRERSAGEIPGRLEEITADWLSEALRASGRLGAGRVASLDLQPIGAGEGFMGVIARLRLAIEGEAGAAPETLIAKLPTDAPGNRVMGELMGVYWREIHFYEELAAQVPVRTPDHHYAALTADPMRARQYRIIAVLDRLPAAMVDWMTRLSKRSMSRSEHRYVLLIEDLAPARVGDQVSARSPEDCGRVLAAVAGMHARFWGGAELATYFWLADQDVNPRMRHRMYLESRPDFERRHAPRIGDRARELLRWIDQNGVALARRLHREAPQTLIHCDLRLDNVFFDDARPDDPIILCDWQLVGRGAAAYDVAYLLSGALAADVSEDVEQALLRGYYEALVAAGVRDHPWERFLHEYERSLLAVLQILATTNQMDLGEARGVDLMDVWLERALARLRGVELSTLL